VTTRYLTSTFLGHSTSADLLCAFTPAAGNAFLKKLLQVSMDGPNVNHKFLRELKKHLNTEPESPVILDMGSCCLHVVHGAFRTAIQATGWKVVEYLRTSYYLFKDVPARRADYIRFSKSELFPQKFCAVRWVENVSVAVRAIQVIPHMIEYVDGVRREKSSPKCASFTTVSEALTDKLLKAKLVFFSHRSLLIFKGSFSSSSRMHPLLPCCTSPSCVA